MSSILTGRLIVSIRLLDSDEHVSLHGTGTLLNRSIKLARGLFRDQSDRRFPLALLIASFAQAESIGAVFYIPLENRAIGRSQLTSPHPIYCNPAAPFVDGLVTDVTALGRVDCEERRHAAVGGDF